MIDRRSFLGGSVATTALWLLPRRLRAADADGLAPDIAKAARESPLIYVSPLARDGSESKCHGEVWFVVDSDALLVVTAPDRWRAKAIGHGLTRARIWVGDHGVWTRAGGKFREAPTFVATANLAGDAATHARALTAFGEKYSAEWPKWGPRFEKGLASGERVLIRYGPST